MESDSDSEDDSDSDDCNHTRSLKATKNLSNDFSDLFERQLFTDVTFKLADGKLKGHKAILSCNILQ